MADLKLKIQKIRNEFNNLPKKGRYNLGSKGVMLLHKIHLLECGIDIEEED